MRWKPTRWLWGLVPLVMVIVLVNVGERPRIERELTVKADKSLQEEGVRWGKLQFNGRDARIRGKAPNTEQRLRAVEIIERMHGVRVIEDQAELIAIVSPFTFTVSRDENRLKLKGHLPDEKTRSEVVGMIRAVFPSLNVNDRTELARGLPDRDAWLSGMATGLKHLVGLTEGNFTLSDLELSLTGRARDSAAYRAMVSDFRGEGALPPDIVPGRLRVLPPRIKPYPWKVRWKDNRVTFSGYVPNEATRGELRALAEKAFANAEIEDGLEIGDGSPRNWVRAAKTSLGYLAKLNEGELSFSETEISLNGTAQQEKLAKSLRSELNGVLFGRYSAVHDIGFVEREVPVIDQHVFAAERKNDDLILTGYVPSQALEARLLDFTKTHLPGVTVKNETQLGKGQAKGWFNVVQAGLSTLARLQSGKFSVSSNKVSLDGHTLKEVDAKAIASALLEKMNGSFSLEHNIGFDEPDIPVVSPYDTGIRFFGNEVQLTGYVPGEEARSALLEVIRKVNRDLVVRDETVIAHGQPADWRQRMIGGLAQLLRLNNGILRLKDDELALDGLAQTESLADAIRAELAAIAGQDAAFEVAFIEPTLPYADPFTWRAELDGNRVVLSGHVPDGDVRHALAKALQSLRPGLEVFDQTEFARGAPDGWHERVLIGLKHLSGLNNGRLSYAGLSASLEGVAQTERGSQSIRESFIADFGEGAAAKLAFVEPTIPTVSPFEWQATYFGEDIRLTGFVPNDEARAAILSAIDRLNPGLKVVDETAVAFGAPDGWLDRSLAGLQPLLSLKNGILYLRNSSVSLSGLVQKEEEADAVKAGLNSALGKDAEIDLAFVERKVPIADPFTWQARYFNDEVELTGFVSSAGERDEIREFLLAGRHDVNVVDRTEIARGAHQSWLIAVRTGIDALMRLKNGILAIEGDRAILAGLAQKESQADEIEEAFRLGLPGGFRSDISLGFVEAAILEVSPYVWRLEIDGSAAVLHGFVPDETSREIIVDALVQARPKITISDRMKVASGAPAGWLEAIGKVIRGAQKLTDAAIVLSDQTLTVSGATEREVDAKSAERDMAGALPNGFATAFSLNYQVPDIPRASPFEFFASQADGKVTLSGHMSSDEARKKILKGVGELWSNANVEDQASIARGAPDGWTEAVLEGLRRLAMLDSGNLSFSDRHVGLSGRTRKEDKALRINDEFINALGTAYDVATDIAFDEARYPTARPFVWQVQRNQEQIVLSGHVPSDDARAALIAEARKRAFGRILVDEMVIARGVPNEESWLNGAIFALQRLGLLAHGNAALTDHVLDLAGKAADLDSYRTASRADERFLPDGIELGEVRVRPPTVDPYVFSIEVTDPSVHLGGYVPNHTSRLKLLGYLEAAFPGRPVEDVTLIADGFQSGQERWLRFAEGAVASLRKLGSGKISLKGMELKIGGVAESGIRRDQALALLETATAGQLKIEDEIIAPEAIEAVPATALEPETAKPEPALAVAAPYVFEATKTGRQLVLQGHIPDENTRADIVEVVRREFPNVIVADELKIAAGAPERFLLSSSIALHQLSRLEIGAIRIEDQSVLVSGRASSEEVTSDVQASVGRSIPTGYTIDSANIVHPERALPEVNVEQVMASTEDVADDVCQVLLNSIADDEKINFAVDSAELPETSFGTLDKLVKVTRRCPTAEIEIAGHTDSDGSTEYNQRLSNRRAASVVSYLTRYGVEATRLKSRGYGEERPLVPNTSDYNKLQNRRIEYDVNLQPSS